MIAPYILSLIVLSLCNIHSELEGLCTEQDMWWSLKTDTQKSINVVYFQVLSTLDSISQADTDDENS